MVARLLPQSARRYAKKRALPPAIQQPSKTYTAELFMDIGGASGRAASNAGITKLRKVLMQDLATGIVNSLRISHINVTMGYPAAQGSGQVTWEGWKQLRARGQLDQKVAVLVDGSPQRPVKNVKVGGRIDIVGEAGVELVVEATKFLWWFLIKYAEQNPGRTWPSNKKGHSLKYGRSFALYLDYNTRISDPAQLNRNGDMSPDSFTSVTNHVPYASKLERQRYAKGAFWLAFKALRKKYGSKLAIRFDFVEGQDSHKQGSAKAGTNVQVAQPVIHIGLPHLFRTRAPNMKKIKRDANRREGR